jgi:hypothetical protein
MKEYMNKKWMSKSISKWIDKRMDELLNELTYIYGYFDK